MKTKFLVPLVTGLFVFSVAITSCSRKEESPEPVSQQQQDPSTPNNPSDPNDPPPPPPPPPPADTTDMFTSSGWITKKVYKDNVEQSNHFLIGASYKFNTPDGYFFSIPNFPSASGTWVFDANTKSKVTLTNQGGDNVWTILTINANQLIIEEEEGGVTYKHEFSH